ncbi:unnamed protein product [Calypogeia fissa]
MRGANERATKVRGQRRSKGNEGQWYQQQDATRPTRGQLGEERRVEEMPTRGQRLEERRRNEKPLTVQQEGNEANIWVERRGIHIRAMRGQPARQQALGSRGQQVGQRVSAQEGNDVGI